MLLRKLIVVLTSLTLSSCNKSDDNNIPCRINKQGYNFERMIPDSVSIFSNIVIGVQWKRTHVCEQFTGFFVDTLFANTAKIFTTTSIDTCNCMPDTTKFIWEYYIHKPDTIGKYPIRISAFYVATFVDTIIVY
jgi:TPP-dependent 2-oxoacid decarboxylase